MNVVLPDDEHFMHLALEEACFAATEKEVPVGAVLVCRNKIIARSHNQTERLNDVTAHAEMLAITAATSTLGGKYLTDCTLYVTVEPCVMCAGAIGWAQLGRLVYGTEDEKRGFRTYAPGALHVKTEVTMGILREECAEEIRRFFRNVCRSPRPCIG
jgi:tRNA(adenine34) deaminase